MRALRFKTFAWVATAGVAMAVSYMISHQVSAERTELESVNAKIAKAHRDIRNLRTELGTRASMRQLERWNVDVMQLATPDANQFLNSDQMLAALNKHGIRRGAPNGAPVMVVAANANGNSALPAPHVSSDVNIASEVIERRETRKKMLAETPGDASRISLKPESEKRGDAAKSNAVDSHSKRADKLESSVFGTRPPSKSDSKSVSVATKSSVSKTTSVKATASSAKANGSGSKVGLTTKTQAQATASKPKTPQGKPTSTKPASSPSSKKSEKRPGQ